MNKQEALNKFDSIIKDVQNRIKELGSTQAGKLSGISKTELTGFANGYRVFSMKRFRRLIEKIF
jgi:hypothetical protein